jgi:hypothetical protein
VHTVCVTHVRHSRLRGLTRWVSNHGSFVLVWRLIQYQCVV